MNELFKNDTSYTPLPETLDYNDVGIANFTDD